jgi:hypothetical protein
MSEPPDIIRDAIWSVLNNVHTALPGIVKAYDPSTNKATIQPALNKNYLSGVIEMPIMENVPVMFQSGVNFAINFPVTVGDYVLLIFCERSIDLWKSVGGQVTPTDPRKFNLSDAVAIPGLMPFTGDFSKNNGTDFIISFGGSTIRIKPDGAVVIETASTVAIGNMTTELLDVLSQTLGFLSSLTAVPAIPSGGSPPQPLTFQAAALALQTQLDAIKGTIP